MRDGLIHALKSAGIKMMFKDLAQLNSKQKCETDRLVNVFVSHGFFKMKLTIHSYLYSISKKAREVIVSN